MIVAIYRSLYLSESFRDTCQHTVAYGIDAKYVPQIENYPMASGPFDGSYTAWTRATIINADASEKEQNRE